MNTDTPRTDAFIDSCGDYEKWNKYRDRLHDYAKTLERENNALTNQRDSLKKVADDVLFVHTEGKLTAAGVLLISERMEVIAKTGAMKIGHPDSIVDARRLVACWNACDGLDTEDLEKCEVGSVVLGLSDERDKLVDALREMRGAWNQSRSFSAMNVMFAQVDSILTKYPETPNA